MSHVVDHAPVVPVAPHVAGLVGARREGHAQGAGRQPAEQQQQQAQHLQVDHERAATEKEEEEEGAFTLSPLAII